MNIDAVTLSGESFLFSSGRFSERPKRELPTDIKDIGGIFFYLLIINNLIYPRPREEFLQERNYLEISEKHRHSLTLT